MTAVMTTLATMLQEVILGDQNTQFSWFACSAQLLKLQSWSCRADAMRKELEAAADAACTFAPHLNIEKTNRLLWKSLSAPVASPSSQSRTVEHQRISAVITTGMLARRPSSHVCLTSMHHMKGLCKCPGRLLDSLQTALLFV